jgi:Co/Zn/Cd efflux system component
MESSSSTGKLCHVEVFDAGNPLAERNTRWAVVLTAVTMIAEVAGGWMFNSMALLADGWHMSSHALALGLSAFAYAAARRSRATAASPSVPGRSRFSAATPAPSFSSASPAPCCSSRSRACFSC